MHVAVCKWFLAQAQYRILPQFKSAVGRPERRANLCGQFSSACGPLIICCLLLGYNRVSFYISEQSFASSLHHCVTSVTLCTNLSAPLERFEERMAVELLSTPCSRFTGFSRSKSTFQGPSQTSLAWHKLACCLASPSDMNPTSRTGGFRSLHPQGAYRSPESLGSHLSQAAERVGRELHPTLGRGFLPSEIPILVSQRTDSPEEVS